MSVFHKVDSNKQARTAHVADHIVVLGQLAKPF